MTDYKIWKPEHDGHAPPNWREGMSRNFMSLTRGAWLAVSSYDKAWSKLHKYQVPVEALDSPNDDAEAPDAVETGKLENIVRGLRQYPAEELAKHGITLAPEKDWATDLFADLLEAWDMPQAARRVRTGNASDDDGAAIELLHARVEQMMAELKEYVVAFGAPWAVQYSRDFGLPEGHLHPRHYDILERCGARLDDFVRAKLEASK